MTLHGAVGRVARVPGVSRLAELVGRAMAPRHRVGVLGVVRRAEDGAVLLVLHRFHRELPWGLPGGWLKGGEDPVTGLARELGEETGLALRPSELLFACRETRPSHLVLVYRGTTSDQELRPGLEVEAASWFADRELPPVSPLVSRALRVSGPER